MPKIGKIHCNVRTDVDSIFFDTEVFVTTNGLFTTTLPKSAVEKLKEYGLTMDVNRAGRPGFFACETYEGLKEKIDEYVKECLSAELIAEKEIIKYKISTFCHYCEGDKKDNFEIYPNGYWLPKRLQNPDNSSCNRWREGNTGHPMECRPYSSSIFVLVVNRKTYKFKSGRTITKEETARADDSRTAVNWLKSLVHIGPEWGNSKPQEVDATEENARVFVQLIKFICKVNRLITQLEDPDNLLEFIKQNTFLQIK